MAIRLLAENRKNLSAMHLDNQPKLLNEIKITYRWETVPVVVEITEGQEKFIGGYDDLREYLNKGKQLLKG